MEGIDIGKFFTILIERIFSGGKYEAIVAILLILVFLLILEIRTIRKEKREIMDQQLKEREAFTKTITDLQDKFLDRNEAMLDRYHETLSNNTNNMVRIKETLSNLISYITKDV